MPYILHFEVWIISWNLIWIWSVEFFTWHPQALAIFQQLLLTPFKLHYSGFHSGGLKKSPMNCILSQLEIEGFTLLVSRKWRLGRILFLELKGHLWPRNVHSDESCFSVLSYLIYPRNGETLQDLFLPRPWETLNHVSRILDFQVFVLALCDPCNSHFDTHNLPNWNLDCLARYKSRSLFF